MTDTMIRYVVDGPLIANAGTPGVRLTPVGQVPVGTPLELTGRYSGPWVEAASPYQKKQRTAFWYHRDYIDARPPKSSPKDTAPTLPGGAATGLASDPSGVLAWAKAVEGTRIDVDNKHGAQCVDLSKAWAFENGAPAGAYGDGVDVARGLSRLPGWRFEGPAADAQPGWIVSLGRPYGVLRERQPDGSYADVFYGHTAVVLRREGARLYVIQQDGSNKNTTAYYGWLPVSAVVGYAVPPAKNSAAVIVNPGDTLSKIAAAAGTTWQALAKLNGLSDPNVIVPGDVLRVA